MSAPKPKRLVIVQDSDTKLFLRADGRWTPDAAAAQDFHESLSAVTFCLQRGLERAHILMKFNVPGASDVVIPISPRSPAPSEETENVPGSSL
ncbi:MAG TPA: hypothetical protein VK846_06110 [Candidatus Limnocylindria bacterium]|nr:hypothetical protein [Candidatus Limnocylindria bacterium]